MTAFVELGAASNFSFLHGASHPEELVVAAAASGYAGLSVCDRNTLAGVVRCHLAARDVGLRSAVGTRLSFTDGTPDVLAWPTDRAAYGRLCRLLTAGNLRGSKGNCRIDVADLEEWRKGLILAPVASGTTPEAITLLVRRLAGNDTELRLAICPTYHGSDARLLAAQEDLCRTLGLRPLATNLPLYHLPERRQLQDVMTAIREHTTLEQAGRLLNANAERHIKSASEMARLFHRIPGALEEGRRVLSEIDFSLDELRYEYPEEPTDPGRTPQETLVRLAWDGAARRYPDALPIEVARVIEHELALIETLDYAPYFLTVYDVVRFARDRGILAQGRGSAANSAVCYCLGITEVDPARGDLLFERFISPERREPPDIDVDFEHERREEVIQYIYDKYGRDRAGIAATIITYRARSAAREVGKALGFSEDAVSALSGTIWGWSSQGVSPRDAERAGLSPDDSRIRHLVRLTHEIAGFPRHLSQHVGGFVITRGRLDELVPISKAAMDGRTNIEWDKDDIDALGILKIDVLALGMLTCLRKGLSLLAEHYADDFPDALRAPRRSVRAVAMETPAGAREPAPEAARHDPAPDTWPDCEGRARGEDQAQMLYAAQSGGSRVPDRAHWQTSGEERDCAEAHTPALAAGWAEAPQAAFQVEKPAATGSGRLLPRSDLVAGTADACRRNSPDPGALALRSTSAGVVRKGPGTAGHGLTGSGGEVRDAVLPRVEDGGEGRDPCHHDARNGGEERDTGHHRARNGGEGRDTAGLNLARNGATIAQPCAECSAVSARAPGSGPPAGLVTATARADDTASTRGNVMPTPAPAKTQAEEGVPQYDNWPVTLATIPGEDPEVYDMICRADTLGVFQIESRAQMTMLPRLRPRTFYDLVIEVAIVRPGPIQGDMVHPYLRRRQGFEKVTYPSPELEAVLSKTLGVPLFQEQAMRIAIVGAGFTPSEADQLRRAMATFKKVGTIGTFQIKMVEGMKARGYDPEFAERCFKQIEGFGEYGFPESHAASFALLVYASCWLKCHYPDVFCAALLNSQPMGFYAPAQIVRDARQHGVEVRPVDINHSEWDCTLEPGPPAAERLAYEHRSMKTSIRSRRAVRFGLRQVKGLSEADMAVLVEKRGRGYDSVRDVWLRTGLKRATLERLADADAFGSLGLSRRDALWAAHGLDKAGRAEDLPLFAAAEWHDLQREAAAVLPPMPPGEEVIHDYRFLSLSLKAHPAAFVRDALRQRGVVPAEVLSRPGTDRRTLSVAGLVLVRQRPGSAKGVIFMTLEDETGIANAIIWPKVFEAHRQVVLGARFIRVTGRVQNQSGVVHIVASGLEDCTPLLNEMVEGSGDIDALDRADEVKRPGVDMRTVIKPRSRLARLVQEAPELTGDAAAYLEQNRAIVEGAVPSAVWGTARSAAADLSNLGTPRKGSRGVRKALPKGRNFH